MGYWKAVSTNNIVTGSDHYRNWSCCHFLPPANEPDASQGHWVAESVPSYCDAATPPTEPGTEEGQLAYVPCLANNTATWTWYPNQSAPNYGQGRKGIWYLTVPNHEHALFCNVPLANGANNDPADPTTTQTVTQACLSNNAIAVYRWTRDGATATTQCMTDDENTLHWTWTVRETTLTRAMGASDTRCYIESPVFPACTTYGNYNVYVMIGTEQAVITGMGTSTSYGPYLNLQRTSGTAHAVGEAVSQSKWVCDELRNDRRVPGCCQQVANYSLIDYCDNQGLVPPTTPGQNAGDKTTTQCDPVNLINWVWVENNVIANTAEDPCPGRCGSCFIYKENWNCITEIPKAWEIKSGGLTLVATVSPWQSTWTWNSAKNDWVWSTGSCAPCRATKPPLLSSQDNYDPTTANGTTGTADCALPHYVQLQANTEALLHYGEQKYNDILLRVAFCNYVQGDELKLFFDGGNGVATMTVGSGTNGSTPGDFSGYGTISIEWGDNGQTRKSSGAVPLSSCTTTRQLQLWIHSNMDGDKKIVSFSIGSGLQAIEIEVDEIEDPLVGIGCGQSNAIKVGLVEVLQSSRSYAITTPSSAYSINGYSFPINDNPTYTNDNCRYLLPNYACPTGMNDCTGFCRDGITPKTITVEIDGWMPCGFIKGCFTGNPPTESRYIYPTWTPDYPNQMGPNLIRVADSNCSPCAYPTCSETSMGTQQRWITPAPQSLIDELNGEYVLERYPGESASSGAGCRYVYYGETSKGGWMFSMYATRADWTSPYASQYPNAGWYLIGGFGTTSNGCPPYDTANCFYVGPQTGLSATINVGFEPRWAAPSFFPVDCKNNLVGATLKGFAGLYWRGLDTANYENYTCCFGDIHVGNNIPGTITITGVEYD